MHGCLIFVNKANEAIVKNNNKTSNKITVKDEIEQWYSVDRDKGTLKTLFANNPRRFFYSFFGGLNRTSIIIYVIDVYYDVNNLNAYIGNLNAYIGNKPATCNTRK